MNNSRLLFTLLVLLAVAFGARAEIMLPGLQAPVEVIRAVETGR